MRRVAVKIAYLGKNFYGSQIQPGLKTVVGDVMSDLLTTGGGKDAEWFNVKTASRTDAGVNATENVIVFNTSFEDDNTLLRALNAVSEDVYYRSVATVDDDFNPRFANERVYRYILPSEGIDFDVAKKCASLFVGEHDFIRFCKLYDKPTVMDLKSIELEKKDDMIVLTFRSRYFLWNMIRKITAAIASVGRGDHPIDDVIDALDGKDINFGLTRPDALTLTEVNYDDVQFVKPSCNVFGKRVREERFSDMIRENFFQSL